MPVSVSIKNVPGEIVDRLRAQAKKNHRSLQGELVAILEAAARPKRLSVDEVYERMRASGIKTASDSVEITRELRDSVPKRNHRSEHAG